MAATAYQVIEIVRLYTQEKKSIMDICKTLGLSRGLVWYYLTQNNVPLRVPVKPGDDKDFSFVKGDPHGCGCERCLKARAKGLRA